MQVPVGLTVLFLVAAAVYFGLAHRVLDRMRLTDTQALVFLGLMVAGSFIDIPLAGGERPVSLNVGGALVPLGLAIYLLSKAGTSRERVRGVLAAVATALAIRVISGVTDFEPPRVSVIDPLWLYALIGGVMGYLAGRSRRSAFIAGTLGVILADVVHWIQAAGAGIRSDISIGGAGVFDAVVLSGVIAVGFAEVFGEARERLQGGPKLASDRPEALRQDEGVFEDDQVQGEASGEGGPGGDGSDRDE